MARGFGGLNRGIRRIRGTLRRQRARGVVAQSGRGVALSRSSGRANFLCLRVGIMRPFSFSCGKFESALGGSELRAVHTKEGICLMSTSQFKADEGSEVRCAMLNWCTRIPAGIAAREHCEVLLDHGQ
jgi:hypothetical protein